MKSDFLVPRVLVIENRRVEARFLDLALSAEGYQVVWSEDSREGLAQISQDPPDLVIVDLGMPQIDGFEVCRRIKESPAIQMTPVIVIGPSDDLSSKVRAWDVGADDFITKPLNRLEILPRCKAFLRIKRLLSEQDSGDSVLFALVRAVEAKSPFTHGHSRRVAALANDLGKQVGLSMAERKTLAKGALLHDVGKIAVPDAILNKVEPLTIEEFELLKQHPVQGVRIVQPLQSVQDAVPIICWHHERPDGSGYPDGLAGSAIPRLTRLLSVVDVYDSLVSERPYRPAFSHRECLQMLECSAARGGLDPDFVDHFCEMIVDDGPSELIPGTAEVRALLSSRS